MKTLFVLVLALTSTCTYAQTADTSLQKIYYDTTFKRFVMFPPVGQYVFASAKNPAVSKSNGIKSIQQTWNTKDKRFMKDPYKNYYNESFLLGVTRTLLPAVFPGTFPNPTIFQPANSWRPQ